MDLQELLSFKPDSSAKRPHNDDADDEEGRPPPKRANGSRNGKEDGQLSDFEKLQLLLKMDDDENEDQGT